MRQGQSVHGGKNKSRASYSSTVEPPVDCKSQNQGHAKESRRPKATIAARATAECVMLGGHDQCVMLGGHDECVILGGHDQCVMLGGHDECVILGGHDECVMLNV